MLGEIDEAHALPPGHARGDGAAAVVEAARRFRAAAERHGSTGTVEAASEAYAAEAALFAALDAAEVRAVERGEGSDA